MTELSINSLADLKRALALPGVTIKLVDMHADTRRMWKPERLARAEAGRKVAKLQTNGWKHDDNSWMYFGKAAEWDFRGDDTATWKQDDGPQHPASYLTYRLIPAT